MWCNSCESDPCTCQRQLTVVKPGPDWLIQFCSVAGCQSTIRVLPGHQEIGPPTCKWHQQHRAYNHRDGLPMVQNDSPRITKDEFGQDLFNAIKMNARRLQAERQGQMDDAKACEKELQPLLEQLEPNDVRRILGMT